MAFTVEQYNELMNVLAARRNRAFREQDRRREEVYSALPGVKALNARISELSVREMEAAFGRTSADRAALRREREELKQNRSRLLKEAGYDDDCLDIRYFCPQCRDTGYVGGRKCGCLKKLESELLIRTSGLPAVLEKENFGTFDPYVFDDSDPIPELLPRQVTQYEYMTRNIMDQVRDYIDSFEEFGGRNILMMGPAGTGKTFLCSCIARAVIDMQHTVAYERAGEMFAMLSEAFFKKASEADELRAKRIENSELLILDDLGTEYTTDFTRARLFSLISNRLSGGLSTIISTNLSLNQLSSLYGERVTSRFIGDYILLPFYGSDLRAAGRRA